MHGLISLEWSESNLVCFVVEKQSNYYTITSLNIITRKILDIVELEGKKV